MNFVMYSEDLWIVLIYGLYWTMTMTITHYVVFVVNFYHVFIVFICFHHLSFPPFGKQMNPEAPQPIQDHPSGEFVKGDLAIAVQVHFRHHCLDRLHRNHAVLDLSIVISESSICLIYLIDLFDLYLLAVLFYFFSNHVT